MWRSDCGLQTAAAPRLMGARPQSAAAIRARLAEPVRRRLGDHESRRAVRGLATTSRQPSPRPASLRGRQPMEPLRPGQEMFHLRTAFQDGLSIAEKPHGQNTQRSGCEGSAGCGRQPPGGTIVAWDGEVPSVRGGCPPIRRRLGGGPTIRPETRHKRAA